MTDVDKEPSVEPEEVKDGASPASESRRKAVSKIAYASPVIAGLLFTKSAAVHAQSGPPAPPTFP